MGVGEVVKVVKIILDRFFPTLVKSKMNKLIEQSKNKKLMKQKFGCYFCAFYSQIDLPNDKLKNLLEKGFLKRMLNIEEKIFFNKLLSLEREKQINEESNIPNLEDNINKYLSLKKEVKEIVASEILKYLEEHIPEYFDEIKSRLPSLCIYKNKIDPTPCIHYTLKGLAVRVQDRLNYQNSKINRRYTTLGILITIIFSLLALVISIFALFK